MKKTLQFLTSVFVIVIIFIACNKTSQTMHDSGEINVLLYHCYEVKNKPVVHICYDSLINDSRCPEDVVCGWAGYVMIKVSFSENGNVHRFKMLYLAGNSQHFNQFGAVSDTSINGYQIKLRDVLPHPKASVPIPVNIQYKAIFTISQ